MRPQAAPDGFNPGRGVNQSCLDHASGEVESRDYYVAGCILIPGDAVNVPVLINQTEYVKTVGNLSDLNQVYLGFHERLQYSVLGPAHIPDNLDFQATSYGSHTECRMVTTQCGAVSTYGARGQIPSYYNFACNNTMAGLNMTGNFLSLGQVQESYLGANASPMLAKNVSDMSVENVNTMSQSKFPFGFQYFNDSAKREQVSSDYTYGLGTTQYGPITNTTNQYFWALAFSLEIQLDINAATKNRNPWGRLNLAASNQGSAEGIMSCKTNISEIVRLTRPPPLPPPPFTALSPRPYLHLPALFSSVKPTLTSPSLPSDL